MTQTQTGSRTVLLVEDDLNQQKLWTHIFKKISGAINLEPVTSVDAALAQLNTRGSHRFDLVLCDIYLEGTQTGVDLQKICSKHFPKLPFILTSSLSVDELARQFGFASGPNTPHYVNKRLGLTAIQDALRRHLAKASIEEGLIGGLPTAPQLLAGIGVALGLTAAMVNGPSLKKESGITLHELNPPEISQSLSAPVKNTALIAAMESPEVKQAARELVRGGLTSWMTLPASGPTTTANRK